MLVGVDSIECLWSGGHTSRRDERDLEEIGCLSTWWKVDDPGKMMLWFAKSFPKLRVLGLEYHEEYDYVQEIKKTLYIELLNDDLDFYRLVVSPGSFFFWFY